ncbi:hypothetical protein NPX13_g7538 [Xylaria arbuscula]|uniref:Uncharacterized protein n=1 Tax=Xylaria arbuscula TaxID=114810 RepID=A0A9W8N9S8_9PEZI|nr:hypothetical protein NPX13_g7538 [Xylaria arbuscula]
MSELAMENDRLARINVEGSVAKEGDLGDKDALMVTNEEKSDPVVQGGTPNFSKMPRWFAEGEDTDPMQAPSPPDMFSHSLHRSSPPYAQASGSMKHTDNLKEKVHLTSASNQSSAGSSDAKDVVAHPVTGTELHGEPSLSDIDATAPITYTPGTSAPIAVFEQATNPDCREAPFAFKGWFKISRINVVAPGSLTLFRMMQLRWPNMVLVPKRVDKAAQDSERFKASMKREWAVVHFEPLTGEDIPPAPQIKEQLALDEEEDTGESSVSETFATHMINDESTSAQQGGDIEEHDYEMPDSPP